MEKIINFIKTKKPGYYLTIVSAILAFIQWIIYLVAFTDPAFASYYNITPIILSIFGVVLGLALAQFKITSRFAPGILSVFIFLSLLYFNRYGYMYYSEVFYGGFHIESLFGMHYGFLWSLILYIVSLILSVTSIFMKQHKDVKEVKEVKGEE